MELRSEVRKRGVPRYPACTGGPPDHQPQDPTWHRRNEVVLAAPFALLRDFQLCIKSGLTKVYSFEVAPPMALIAPHARVSRSTNRSTPHHDHARALRAECSERSGIETSSRSSRRRWYRTGSSITTASMNTAGNARATGGRSASSC
jgi:hypothetical protein